MLYDTSRIRFPPHLVSTSDSSPTCVCLLQQVCGSCFIHILFALSILFSASFPVFFPHTQTRYKCMPCFIACLSFMAHRDTTLYCTVQFKEQLRCSVVYRTGSQNSVNPWMSLCSARVRFRDSANVSPSSAGLPKINIYFQKRKPMCQSPKWMKMQFSWGTEHWFMDQYYLLHLQFRSAHGKLTLVKLGGWCINLLTGFQHWVIFFLREHLSFVKHS